VPGVAARLGLGYAAVSAVNPAVVYASVSGFGQDGPYAQRPGYDLIAQAMGGLMSVTGEPDRPPVKCGLPVTDLGAGMLCAYGILAALFHRQRTGEGQYLETSLYDAAVAMSVWESTEYWSTGRVPRPLGSAHRMSAPYQALRTADGYLTVGANNQRLWTRLCGAIGRPELAGDPRFATNPDRMAHREELAAELATTLAGRTTGEWVEVLLAAGVPAGPVHDYEQVLADPHTLARGLVRTIEHPAAGPVKVLGFPVKFTATPAAIRRPPPLLDQHRAELLGTDGTAPDGERGGS
jgi:crotonobetainyl-CoA:carnitine CoA-transferase CaiB-like acyl-CoA transferase